MNKTLIGIKDSIMYKIAQFAFFLLTIILLGGGIYSWSTLKEMETKLPITSLEQHNNIKTMIDGLVRLSNSLVSHIVKLIATFLPNELQMVSSSLSTFLALN